jgi:hypothetical protein
MMKSFLFELEEHRPHLHECPAIYMVFWTFRQSFAVGKGNGSRGRCMDVQAEGGMSARDDIQDRSVHLYECNAVQAQRKHSGSN